MDAGKFASQVRTLRKQGDAAGALKLIQECRDSGGIAAEDLLRHSIETHVDLENWEVAQQEITQLASHPGGGRLRPFLRRAIELGRAKWNLDTIRLAVLGNITLEPFVQELNVELFARRFQPDMMVGGFDQFRLEILNAESGLYKSNPDAVFLALDYSRLLPELYEYCLASSDDDCLHESATLVAEIHGLVARLREHLACRVLVSNAVADPYSVGGFLERSGRIGHRGLVARLNAQLSQSLDSIDGTYVNDVDETFSAMGITAAIDPVMDCLAQQPWSLGGLIGVARQTASFVQQLRGKAKKCLVLDLDNTLWGGVVGEDGVEGIQLGPDRLGRAFHQFQKQVLRWHRQGVILAICSKNNPDDVREVFQKHPFMVLKEEHFAAFAINWSDKPSNIRQLADEINVGIDSLVFLDDSPFERDAVARLLPDVLVPQLPQDPTQRPRFLANLDVFQSLHLTTDDLTRGQNYAADRKRKEVKRSATSLEEYLAGLHMVAQIQEVGEASLDRVAQLLQRTNQFNLTVRRHTMQTLRSNWLDNPWTILTLNLADRHGNSGLVGVAITEAHGKDLVIDTFLMSCRVLGRNVEQALLAYVARRARSEGMLRLIGQYIPAAKNQQVADFYSRHGMHALPGDKDVQQWSLDLCEHSIPFPPNIQVNPK